MCSYLDGVWMVREKVQEYTPLLVRSAHSFLENKAEFLYILHITCIVHGLGTKEKVHSFSLRYKYNDIMTSFNCKSSLSD